MTPVTRLGTVSGLLLGLAAFSLVPTPAAAGVGWITKCPYDHSLMADPIVFPGQKGAGHLHDFLANRSTNAFSTYSSLEAAGTTCGTTGDRAAYWVPALYRNGVRVLPAGSFDGRSTREQFYYRKDNLASGSVIEPFPPDFRMILGFAHATSLADAQAHGAPWGSEMYWGCADNSPDVKATSPINCSTGIITLHLQFPNCWDGVTVAGDESAAGHVKYPHGGVCPAGFGHKLPRLFERMEWPVGTSSSGITLSSGPTYTAHGDFLNSWDAATLSRLVRDCLNKNVDCGTDPK